MWSSEKDGIPKWGISRNDNDGANDSERLYFSGSSFEEFSVSVFTGYKEMPFPITTISSQRQKKKKIPVPNNWSFTNRKSSWVTSVTDTFVYLKMRKIHLPVKQCSFRVDEKEMYSNLIWGMKGTCWWFFSSD